MKNIKKQIIPLLIVAFTSFAFSVKGMDGHKGGSINNIKALNVSGEHCENLFDALNRYVPSGDLTKHILLELGFAKNEEEALKDLCVLSRTCKSLQALVKDPSVTEDFVTFLFSPYYKNSKGLKAEKFFDHKVGLMRMLFCFANKDEIKKFYQCWKCAMRLNRGISVDGQWFRKGLAKTDFEYRDALKASLDKLGYNHAKIVNAFRTDDGSTLLHQSVCSSDFDLVKFIIKVGADKDAKSFFGSTPLHLVAHFGFVDLVELFKGADVNARNSQGETPLHIAVKKGKTSIVKPLVALGANINAQLTGGATPLHWAVLKDSHELVRLLMDLGANPALAWDGLTPLHSAIKKGSIELVKLLLQSGTDLTAPCKNGFTYLYYAVVAGKKEIIELFIDRGLDLYAKSKNGITCLDFCNQEVLQYLQSKGLIVEQSVEPSLDNLRKSR